MTSHSELPTEQKSLIAKLGQLWANDPERPRPERDVLKHWTNLFEQWAETDSLWSLRWGFCMSSATTRRSSRLSMDLEEPFRWLVDLSVLQAFESKILELHDFYFTGDDYRYRFEHGPKIRFIEILRERFNSGVNYKGRVLKWDSLIHEKTNELAKYMNGRSIGLNFHEPTPMLQKTDSRELREMILHLTQSEARKRGIGRSTLHYLHKNAASSKPFRVYKPAMQKIMN